MNKNTKIIDQADKLIEFDSQLPDELRKLGFETKIGSDRVVAILDDQVFKIPRNHAELFRYFFEYDSEIYPDFLSECFECNANELRLSGKFKNSIIEPTISVSDYPKELMLLQEKHLELLMQAQKELELETDSYSLEEVLVTQNKIIVSESDRVKSFLQKLEEFNADIMNGMIDGHDLVCANWGINSKGNIRLIDYGDAIWGDVLKDFGDQIFKIAESL